VSLPPGALLTAYPGPIIELAEGLRALVRAVLPEAIEAVRPGWRIIGYDLPVGRRTAFFAWIMPQAVHIHLGFPQGVLLDDPSGLLDGAGETKRARWLTLDPGAEIPVEPFRAFLRDAARIAGLSPSERQAIGYDREARSMPIDARVSKSQPR
jgi:hypothetical protein